MKFRKTFTKPLLTAALGAGLLLPALASASPNYSYLDVNYVSADLDNGPTVDGFGINGSLRLSNELHLVASYDVLSEGRVDADFMTVGLGYNQLLVSSTDFVARAGFARAKVDVSGFGSDSDNGLFGQAGIRSMVTEEVELNAFITHTEVGGSNTSADLGAVYYVAPNIGINLGLSFSDDANVYRGGVRFSF
jgi:hypothetical protein